MRLSENIGLPVALVGSSVLVAALASACSWWSCTFSPRWSAVFLQTPSPPPGMSALVFDVWTGGSLCVASIAQHVELAVSLDGVEVGGAFTGLGGDTLVWRPQEPLASGAEGIARIVVDNAALGPTNGEGAFDDGPCGPELLEVELPFTVAGDEASPLPALPPPLVELRTRPMDRSFAGITCCPGIVPLYQDGDCVGGLYWEEEGGCALL